MMHDLIIIMSVIFIASLIRMLAGFGDALLGMPLLLFFYPLESADTIVATYGLFIGFILTKQYLSIIKTHRSELTMLILSSAVGVFLGALALKKIDHHYLIYSLALLLLAYPCLYYFYRYLPDIKFNRNISLMTGLMGGLLGGSINTNGPPFIIYGQMRRWSPIVFIALIQPILLLGNIFNIVSYVCLKTYQYQFAFYTILSLPLIYCSHKLSQFLQPKIHRFFPQLVVGIVFFSGLLILAK